MHKTRPSFRGIYEQKHENIDILPKTAVSSKNSLKG